jgi:hypothetical protein
MRWRPQTGGVGDMAWQGWGYTRVTADAPVGVAVP